MCRDISVFFLLFILVEADKIVVKVKQGKLTGQREDTLFDHRLYFAFYRIPYAQSPIGNLRFKDPQPVKKWNGTRDARTPYFGACPQTHIVHKNGLYGVEDCLYLNIYTPLVPKTEDTKLLPVIVWIHGYAFASCFSHLYGPDFFVDKGIILVTLSHRIGVFGFLKYNETDTHANMGLKDIAIALKWIRSNIKEFGGDKNKVTLMANGSGATFISLLMLTEASKWFSKVIIQSGSIFSPSLFQSDPIIERNKLNQELKRKHLLLKSAESKEIVSAAHDIFIRNNKDMENLQRPVIPFTPVIEPDANTSLLMWTPKEFYDTLKNNSMYLNKPILIGYNTQESISEVMPFIHNPYYIKTFLKFFKYIVPFSDGCSYNSSSNVYKKVAKIIKDRYFKESDTDSQLKSLLKYASDLIKFPILKFVKTYRSTSQNNIFMYKFDYRGKMNAVKATSMAEKKVRVSGVASGDELCYLFKCEPLWETYKYLDKDSKDKKFIKEISNLWANFVKFGNPTPIDYDGNVTWLPVDLKLNNVLYIKNNLKLVSCKDDNAMFDFWNLLYETYYQTENCNTKHDEL